MNLLLLCQFSQISDYALETVQDRDIVTMTLSVCDIAGLKPF